MKATKSDFAKYRKAIKKRFIKRLGRKIGPWVFQQKGLSTVGWYYSYLYKSPIRQEVNNWIAIYRREQIEAKRSFYEWLRQPIIINSPGGQIDPVEGIYREFKNQIYLRGPDTSIIIHPMTFIAY